MPWPSFPANARPPDWHSARIGWHRAAVRPRTTSPGRRGKEQGFSRFVQGVEAADPKASFLIGYFASQRFDIALDAGDVVFHGGDPLLVLGVVALIATPLGFTVVEFLAQIGQLLFFRLEL